MTEKERTIAIALFELENLRFNAKRIQTVIDDCETATHGHMSDVDWRQMVYGDNGIVERVQRMMDEADAVLSVGEIHDLIEAYKQDIMLNTKGDEPKDYNIVKKSMPVEFTCRTCGCVFQLPVRQCDIGTETWHGPKHGGEHRYYHALCPECGKDCRTWCSEHVGRLTTAEKE